MELLLGLSALIFALAVLALVGFLIPTIMELRRSLQQVERTTAHLNAHLPEIVSNLHDITDNVSEMTEMGREQLEGVGRRWIRCGPRCDGSPESSGGCGAR